MMELGKTYSGFTVTAIEPLEELEARLVQMEHGKSGARLVWLDRKDENKTFGITFRTLPWNDTGVFHILEHSVLCGSDRYPVKEPFVELMKSSLQTFLNAFTYPGHTMYPVCSRNDKDFLNLLRVYMDAVLHPVIYHKPEIFRQEGWHFEMPQDGGEPSYKGVVFNEMKGAFASPDTLMQKALFRALFPDNCYRYVSGGDPAHIPELTYEEFLGAHRRFYHPSNAYILLDGKMDMEQVLAVLDREFLSAYDRQEGQPAFAMQAPVQAGQVRACYEVSPSESAADRARLAWGGVLGDFTCREDVVALQALSDALCGGSQSPLKQKLLSAGLAQDVFVHVMDGMLQPFAVLEARNINGDRAEAVNAAIREELERLVREGLDHEQITATLANMEFQMRERDYGSMPQGLVLCMSMLDSWLYGGEPGANLEVGALFTSLNQKLEEGYFEALLERVFLKNSHSCQILLLPSPTLGEENRAAEAARLQAASGSWSAEERAALVSQQESLDAWQSSSDTPEDIAKLPALRLDDIPAKPEDIPLEVGALAGGVPLLRHAIPTSGVGYIHLYFDISDLAADQLPCVTLLCTLLGDLDTQDHNILALQKLQRLYLGALHFGVDAYGKANEPKTCRTFLTVSFSALESKLDKAVGLVAELLTGTRFHDSQKLRELLRQSVAQMEQAVPASGHSFALTRVSAGFSAEGAVREHSCGLTCLRWFKALEKEFEGRASQVMEDLKALQAKIFTTGRLTASVTGVEDACAASLERTLLLPASERRELPCAVQPWGVRKEGVIIPADISFAVLGGSLLGCGVPYSGTVQVASRTISLAYLWNAVRVQGGAYGTGLSAGDSGNACFYSYRDPGAARSLDCYRQTADFLAQFTAAGPDLTGLIIGAVADSDPLMLPNRKGRASDGLYWKGVTYADRCRRREELLSATPEKLAALGASMAKLTAEGGICVIGSRQLVESCALDEVSPL